MIIQSIRLKNIKSFGEGRNGNGVTVGFAPGVNRIAGRNGNGKTTLIESIGYALFLTSPQFEEGFKTDKYFLRHGSKTGEMDVTFEFHGDVFRIERGIGSANKRRSKIIQLSDSSTCAEGEKEVAIFLCKLFDFPNSTRFSELFSKLIGVRQGHLTRPFDSKPTASRKFFEPLLEVEIFRRCYDELKKPLERIAEFLQEEKVKLGGVTERINERADSEALANEKRKAVGELGGQLKLATTALEKTLKAKIALEEKEAAVRKIEQKQANAKTAAGTAEERRKSAEIQLGDSKNAAETAKTTKPAHELYLSTEKELTKLRIRQKEQAELEKRKADEENNRTHLAAKTKAAMEQAGVFSNQKKVKTAERDETNGRLNPLAETLAESKKTFTDSQNQNTQLREDSQELKPFVSGLANFVAKQADDLERISKLNKELKNWDTETLKNAVREENDAERQLKTLQKTLAETTERRKNLSAQLEQIGGGVCPFLKETCEQFDPKRVTGNLEVLTKEIATLSAKLPPAEATHQASRKTRETLVGQEKQLAVKRSNFEERITDYAKSLANVLPETVAAAVGRIAASIDGVVAFPTPSLVLSSLKTAGEVRHLQTELEQFSAKISAWRDSASPKVQASLAAFENAKSKRQKDEQELDHLKKRAAELDAESKNLAAKENEQLEIQKDAKAKTETASARIGDLETQLKAFADLSKEIEIRETTLSDNRKNHEAFLTATPLANKLTTRQNELKKRTDEKAVCNANLKKHDTALATARSDFDPEKLVSAREDHETKGKEAAAFQVNLKHAEVELKREEKRFDEWKKACDEKTAIDSELDRLDAATDLGQLARRVLRDSAPTVAQHLCSRIADRAQVIFSQINQTPAELKWDSESYSLRIEPSDRRFAMLSGGEQTKLALAMTLAMTLEFSTLKFCIFDEPTYGVDAESRPLLAGAVLEAQAVAGLEQLLLVSHDDAFDGKIEHAILLEKSTDGSNVA